MKAPSRRVPKTVGSTAELTAFQRFMAQGVIRPLTPKDRMQSRWIDGRRSADVASEFIRPNDRLTSVERWEIYNRMYWFRILDAFRSDCPGLVALLGEKKFWRLAQAYLAECPSQSFTLRDLCSRLEAFIQKRPALTAPKTLQARDVARFEWAQTVAFDGEGRAVITPSDIASTPPTRLRLGLQPYVTLLTLEYPMDDYVVSVKQRETLRSEASNAPDSSGRPVRLRRAVPAPRKGRVQLAVHRYQNRLYHKRLEPAAYRILEAIRAGRTLSQAIAQGRGAAPDQVRAWFTSWMGLGWFHLPSKH